jgi:O-antigen/teichoic acid export membrane protein
MMEKAVTEKKSLVKNSIFNMIYKGFTALFPLITTTYISRVLLPAGVGRVGYANTIVAYFVLVASLGLPSYGVKATAQSNDTKENRSRTFWELFFINLSATLVCIVAYFVFVNNFPHFADRKPLFNIMGLMLVLNIFNIDWFYQGMEEYTYIATRSIIVKILSFVAMLIFVRDEGDYLAYAFILCVATAGNNLLNAVNLRKYVSRPQKDMHLGRHMRPVLVLLASTIATEVYTMLDTLMLEYYHGETSVGYYSNPVKIVRMTYTVVIALVAVFYPRISMHYKQKEYGRCNELLSRGLKIMLLLALPCTIGLALTAEYTVPLLFGEAFLPSVDTLRILSVLVLVFSVAYFLGHIVLTATGLERKILRATIAGAIINAVANLLLIPNLQQNGAAIASVLSEVAVTVILLWHARDCYRLTIGKNYIYSTIAALGILIAAVSGMKLLLKEPWMVLIIIPVAAVLYFGCLLVMRNEAVMELVAKVKNKR